MFRGKAELNKSQGTHKNCETCKMYEKEIQERKDEIQNLESNFKQHIKKKSFFKMCKCHGYILYSKAGYNRHMESQKK